MAPTFYINTSHKVTLREAMIKLTVKINNLSKELTVKEGPSRRDVHCPPTSSKRAVKITQGQIKISII